MGRKLNWDNDDALAAIRWMIGQELSFKEDFEHDLRALRYGRRTDRLQAVLEIRESLDSDQRRRLDQAVRLARHRRRNHGKKQSLEIHHLTMHRLKRYASNERLTLEKALERLLDLAGA
jgi:macrodomain Ter protein organizer (MatP/YcbG family)